MITPKKPKSTAIHLFKLIISPNKGAEAAVTKSGAIAKIACASAIGIRLKAKTAMQFVPVSKSPLKI